MKTIKKLSFNKDKRSYIKPFLKIYSLLIKNFSYDSLCSMFNDFALKVADKNIWFLGSLGSSAV